ncbi:MAG: NAD(+)/NADH kinase [Nitriliruptorales bacterium]
MKVGLVIHSGRTGSREAAMSAARTLGELDADVVAVHQDGLDGDDNPAEDVPGVALVPADGFGATIDVALSLGGDGTFLRAAHLCRDDGVPVLGLNLGRLGFLVEVDPDGLDDVLRAVVAGDFEVEERGTLEATLHGPSGEEIGRDWALNEVSVEKTARQRLLLMDVYVGSSLFAKVPADAVVLATATGSTAYAFSAGGPILSPRVSGTLVTPVAPHSVFGRTLVVAEDETVRVHVIEDQQPAVVSCDGRSPVTLPAGGEAHVVGGGRPVRVARVAPTEFYSLVRTKFGLR